MRLRTSLRSAAEIAPERLSCSAFQAGGIRLDINQQRPAAARPPDAGALLLLRSKRRQVWSDVASSLLFRMICSGVEAVVASRGGYADKPVEPLRFASAWRYSAVARTAGTAKWYQPSRRHGYFNRLAAIRAHFAYCVLVKMSDRDLGHECARGSTRTRACVSGAISSIWTSRRFLCCQAPRPFRLSVSARANWR